MDKIAWVYGGYLEQLSNLNMHYQNLTILVLGGIGASYKIIQKKNYRVNALFAISFLTCIVSLFFGLKTYQSLLQTFIYLTTEPSRVILREIGFIDFQFYMSVAAVIFFFFAYVVLLVCEK